MIRKHKIVVVDDDLNILKIMQLFLEKRGFEVVTVSKGLEAIPVIERQNPSLLLLDIMLDNNLSSEFIVHNIRENKDLCKLPIIMVTSITDECSKEKFLNELGCIGYVEKPFDSDDLLEKIHDAL